MRRLLKGLPLREWEEEESDLEDDVVVALNDEITLPLEEEVEEAADEDETDPLILESGRVLADYITLNNLRVSAITDSPRNR